MGKGAGNALSTGLGIASPLLGAGLGIYNAIQAGKEKADAQEALDNYQRQELNNVADGLQVSTLGSDLQRQEQARLSSGQIQASREAGVRGIIGNSGRIEAGNQRVNAQIGADLDMQQKQIDQIRAEDEARIRNMQENREQNDINALSSQYQAGKQDQNMGFGNIIQSAGMLGNSFGRNGQLANSQNSGYSISGSPMDMTNPQYQTPANQQYNTQNTYGNFFSRNPYTPTQGAENAPNWYNNIPNAQYL